MAEKLSENQDYQLAIVGYSCCFPGDIDSAEAYWNTLLHGQSVIGELPNSRLNREFYFRPLQPKRGQSYSILGGAIEYEKYVRQLNELTHGREISDDEGHQLTLLVAAEALRSAGYDPVNLSTRNVGVYVGHTRGSNIVVDTVFASCIETTINYLNDIPSFQAFPEQMRCGVINEVVSSIQQQYRPTSLKYRPRHWAHYAARNLTHAFGLNGPSLVLNAACASSLIGLSIAGESLRSGEIDMAIVGGASFLKFDSMIHFSHSNAMSVDGSKPFDNSANGLVPSEGHAYFVVKLLGAAERDRDRICGVIHGIGCSSDGKGKGLWAPRKEGQLKAIERAYHRQSSVHAKDIEYLEAHATSTRLGDTTELMAMKEFLDGKSMDGKKIKIGSSKANLGHMLETAGAAGLIKILLAMDHGLIPKQINVESLSSYFDWSDSPFEVAQVASPWPRSANCPRTAAINAFGIGGINAHLVVQQYEADRNHQIPNRLTPPSKPENAPIAVIGMSSILPGAIGIDAFRDLLVNGIDPKSAPNSGRWELMFGSNASNSRLPIPPRESLRNGYIEGYQYDWKLHKIPPLQLQSCNPLQFMVLDAVDKALKDAGYLVEKDLPTESTGVIVGSRFDSDFANALQMGLRLPEVHKEIATALNALGCESSDVKEIMEQYSQLLLNRLPALNDETGGFTTSTLATRVTKVFNLMGGAYTIDSGSCSSLAALQIAMNSLRSRSVDMMICATGQQSVGRLAHEEMLLNDGVINPLAEGAAVLVLKRYEDAIRDGDEIKAILHGIACTQQGSVRERTEESIRRVLNASNVEGSDISLLEIASSGTADFYKELLSAANKQLLSPSRTSRAIAGSLSEQIGHSIGASGLVATIKTILELQGLFAAAQPFVSTGAVSIRDAISEQTDAISIAESTQAIQSSNRDGRHFGLVTNADRDGTTYSLLIERPIRTKPDNKDATSIATPMRQDFKIPIYDDAGETSYDIGREHGIRFAHEIRANIQRLETLPPAVSSFLPDHTRVPFSTHKILLSDSALDELQGIADGAGVTSEQLFAFNMAMFPGCVQFFVPTTDAGTVHGMNLDLPISRILSDSSNQTPPRAILRRRTTHGGKVFYVSVPGQVGTILGMNSHGISVTSSMLLDRSIPHDPSGNLYSVIVQEILSSATSIEKAALVLSKSRRHGGWGGIISDLKRTKALHFEFDGEDIKYQWVNKSRILSNHSTMLSQSGEVPAHSQTRLERLQSLLGDQDNSARTLSDCTSALRDRFNHRTGSIAKHRSMNSIHRLDNVLSWTFVLEKGELCLAETSHDTGDNNEQQAYQTLRFDELFHQQSVNKESNLFNQVTQSGNSTLSSIASAISRSAFEEINTAKPNGEPPIHPGDTVCHRFVMRVVPAGLPQLPAKSPFGKKHTLIVGEAELTALMAAKLAEAGMHVTQFNLLADQADLLQAFDELDSVEPVYHLVLVPPNDGMATEEEFQRLWNEDLSTRFHTPFQIVQCWYQRQRERGLLAESSLLASIGLGGDFGFTRDAAYPHDGGLQGLVKAIRREVRHLDNFVFRAKVVDHATTTSTNTRIDDLVREFFADDNEAEVGYVDHNRVVARPILAPITSEDLDRQNRSASKRLKGTWIFTGGAQGITAVTAKEMAKHFDVKLHLIGSTHLQPIEQNWLKLDKEGLKQLKSTIVKKALEAKQVPIKAWEQIEKSLNIERTLEEIRALGRSVTYHACDVSDNAKVAQLVSQIEGQDGPVVGLVHGAGFESSCKFEKKKLENVTKTIHVKATGLINFLNCLNTDALKYVVGFGSTAGCFGGVGQTDYSAANEMLAKILESHRNGHPWCRTSCLKWTSWDDVGMAVRPESKVTLSMMDRKFLPSSEGAQHFLNELVLDLPEPEVTVVEWDYYKRFFPDKASCPQAGNYTMNNESMDGTKTEKIDIDLGVVQETLLIPLYCRALESQRTDAIFHDQKAVEICRNLKYDFSVIDSEPFLHLEIAIRTEVFDKAIRQFLKNHPTATVVNLGAGLDGRFERVDNGQVRWFDLDMPDSIELRRKFYPESSRDTFIVKSMFDYSWIDDVLAQRIDVSSPVLIVAEGLLLYFTEEQNKELFQQIANRLSNAHFLVHAICPEIAQDTSVCKSVAMTKATFKWGISEFRELEKWDPRFRVLKEWHFIKRHLWRWLKLTLPINYLYYYTHYYQNMKVGLIQLNQSSGR